MSFNFINKRHNSSLFVKFIYVNLYLSMKFAVLRRRRLATGDLIVEFVLLRRLKLAT